MPATSNMYVERRLTEVSIEYQNGDYVADQVSPLVPVPDKSGKILEEDKTVLQADPSGDDVIGQGAYPGLVTVNIQDRQYGTFERSKGIFVHDDEIAADAAQGAPYGPKIRKTEIITERLLLNREVRVATAFRNSANWASGHTATPATKWDAATGSDPVGDVNTAVLKVKNDLQLVPNTAVVPWEVARYLMNNSKVIGLTSGGASVANAAIDYSPAAVMALLQRIFGLKNILIPSAGNFGGNMKAGFNGGVPAGTGGVWADDVWVGFVPPRPGRGIPSAAYTYTWVGAFEGQARNAKGLVVTEDYDKRARGYFIDARTYTDERVLIPEAGFIITNTLNAF